MKEDRDNFFEMAILLSQDLIDEYQCFYLDGVGKKAKPNGSNGGMIALGF
jgi:hypothetical protein